MSTHDEENRNLRLQIYFMQIDNLFKNKIKVNFFLSGYMLGTRKISFAEINALSTKSCVQKYTSYTSYLLISKLSLTFQAQ